MSGHPCRHNVSDYPPFAKAKCAMTVIVSGGPAWTSEDDRPFLIDDLALGSRFGNHFLVAGAASWVRGQRI
jgi:hypothetical protein